MGESCKVSIGIMDYAVQLDKIELNYTILYMLDFMWRP